jgi:hypothetical protein
MTQVFATPKPGLLVRRPDTGKPLAPGGEFVDLSSYWRRREKDGDVTLSEDSQLPASGLPVASRPIRKKN